MKLHSLRCLLFFLLSIATFPCLAKTETVYIDDIIYNIDTESATASVAMQNPYAQTPNVPIVMIPESVTSNGETYPVVALEDKAFYNCSKLTKVVIPNSVVSIGEGAFRYCPSLVDVTLPENLKSLSRSMFDGCTALETIDLPIHIKSIPEFAFSQCESLKSIVIPDGVETIGSQAFQYTYRLSTITLPPSLKEINGTLSDARYPLIPTIHISDLNAFCNIDTQHSRLCGNSVWYLYLNGEEVTDVKIPEGTEDINIWDGCESLKSIATPNSVTICRFDNSNLSFISMSSATKEVEIGGIEDYNLKRVDIYALEPPKLTTSDWQVREAVLHVPVGRKEVYQNNEEWSIFSTIIDDLTGESGVSQIQVDIDSSLPVEVFNLNGVKIGNSISNLPAGLYILRQGSTAKKIAVK